MQLYSLVLGERPDSFKRWLNLVTLLVQRDLRVRYRGSVLGYLWSMMNPLLYMAILSFVFYQSHLMRFKIDNFAMFLLSGILTWNLFLQSLAIGVNSILGNGSLLRKVRVPATIFPAAAVLSCLVNFLLALIPFVIVGLVTGLKFTGWVFVAPIIVIPYLGFIYGIVLILSSLNVSFRDVGHTLDPVLSMLFYATPIIYPLEQLPEKYQKLAWLNPLAHFVSQMRNILYYGVAPDLYDLGVLYLLGLVSVAIGGVVYRKMRDGFVYNV